MSDQWQVLYATGDGSGWLVLRGVFGKIPPAEVDGLALLGETTDVIREVMDFRVQAAKRSGATRNVDIIRHIKTTFATELGVDEARLTDYANGGVFPDLSSTGWGKLAKAYCFTS